VFTLIEGIATAVPLAVKAILVPEEMGCELKYCIDAGMFV